MKAKKKISLMLAVVMLLQIILPMVSVIWESGFTIKSVAAEIYEATVDGITWTYEVDEQNNAINVKPKDKSNLPREVTIPSALDEHAVTSIGNHAFYDCNNLTNIIIPDSVTSIGNYAFCGCRSLKSIIIPDSVTSIGDRAFTNCIRLTSIIIPDSATSIGEDAFVYCISLIEITVDINNTNYSSEEGVLFNKEKTELIQYPIGNKKINYTIPDSVTNIGDYAFDACSSLTSIIIPDSVTSIGNYAFYFCSNLTDIRIPDSVTSIGDYAFDACSSLTSIIIPDSATSIGENVFRSCSSLIEITVDINNTNYSSEEGVLFNKEKTELIQYPIGNKKINYTIPEGVIRISINAFEGCSSLTSITIPQGVTKIGAWAFSDCSSLTQITVDINNTNYSSEEGVLFNKEKTELIQYPIGNKKINYTIPEGVTRIVSSAFSNCRSLASIIIPDSVTSIESSVFSNCNSLIIYCFSGSYAEQYAKKSKMQCISILKGDANGDNKVDFMDILAINKHRLGKAQLEGIYLEAADVNGDNKVDFMDILQINKYRLGKIDSL